MVLQNFNKLANDTTILFLATDPNELRTGVGSQTGPHTWRARRDQRNRQDTPDW